MRSSHDKTVRITDYKKRIRRNRRNRKIVLCLFLLIVLMCIAFFAPWFKINKITVEGNARLSSDEIVSASTVGYGRNVFRTSIKHASKGVMKLPYVSSVKITRKFPATVKIKVIEYEVAAYIAAKDKYIYIGSDGKMLEQNSAPPSESVPLIENSGAAAFDGGKLITTKPAEKGKYIIDVLNVLKTEKLIDRVTLINVPDANNLSLTIDNRLEVFVGENANLTYKISFLAMQSYKNLGENTRGYLNVSSGDKAVYKQY